MVGTELLLGQITDSNAVFLARRLAELGIDLHFKSTVGDNLDRIVETVSRAAGRADLVIVVGGLGPTEDDLTREAVARATGRELEFHQELMDAITARFEEVGVPMSENNQRQARVPHDAIVIPNPVGTAPSFAVEYARSGAGTSLVVALPGVPREMEHLWNRAVVPMLADLDLLAGTVIQWRLLKICGEGESQVDSAIGDLVQSSTNPTIGLLASPGQVTIRIAAKADSADDADKLIDQTEKEIRDRLGDRVYGTDNETLAGVLGRLIEEREWRMAVVDAATGGTVVSMLAPDAGRVIAGAYVLPNADSVMEFAGAEVEADTDSVCRTLADMARLRAKVDVVLVIAAVGDETYVYAAGPGFDRTRTISRPTTAAIGRARVSLGALELLRRQILRCKHE